MFHVDLQKKLFSRYSSLDLQNKLYQIKALRLGEKYLRKQTNTPKLLDIGCADGSFAEYAGKTLDAQAYGIDISRDSIQKAKIILSEAVQHDVSNPLPYPDMFFDLVFATEVIEHLYDTDFFLAEIRRILLPGGVLILSTPNLASLKNRIRLLMNLYPEYLEYSTKGAGHIHLYTSKILQSQLKLQRFKIIKLTSANFPAPYVTHSVAPRLYRNIAMKLGDTFPTLGSHIIIVASR